MGKLFDKRWVGDQLVAVVGLLVAAAMAALLGAVILVAERVDESAVSREQELLKATLSGIDTRIRSDLTGITINESSLTESTPEQARWLHRHFGGRLYQGGLYDLAFVFGAQDNPIYSNIGGELVSNLTKFDVDQKLIKLIGDVRTSYEGAIAIGDLLAAAGETIPPPAPVYGSIFTRISAKARRWLRMSKRTSTWVAQALWRCRTRSHQCHA